MQTHAFARLRRNIFRCTIDLQIFKKTEAKVGGIVLLLSSLTDRLFMLTVFHRRIRLGWSFIVILAFFYFFLLFHDFIGWAVEIEYPLIGLLLCTILFAVLLWRGFVQKAKFALTGLEAPAIICILAGVISFFLSPDRRLSLESGLWALLCLGLFFFFSDIFSSGSAQVGVLSVLLGATGVTAAFAFVEVWFWYSRWWQITGSILQLPPYPYRFITLMGHANTYMAFTNLLAPVALVLFLNTSRRSYRFLAALWLFFYLISVPFSSSRGGWLGLAAWAFVLLVLWLPGSRIWKTSRGFILGHKAWIIFAGVIGFGFLLAAGFKFWMVFSAHPSHGGDPFGGREALWSQALQVWQLAPWFGVGVGRYPYGFLQVAHVFPPGFWPFHAHDWFLTVLAEQGVVGLAAFLLLIVAGVRLLVQWRRQIQHPYNLYASAVLAGMTGFLVHSIFDDFSTNLTMMVTLALLAAWTRNSMATQDKRPRQISSAILALPLLPMLILFGWLFWAQRPMDSALQAARQGDFQMAAELASQSAQRDLHFVFYQSQAGIAWARTWRESGNPTDLARARSYFETARNMEPSYSLSWANSAFLDWTAGQTEAAIQEMQQAVLLAPREPSFSLNLGWFHEQQGNLDQAQLYYQKSLEINPDWDSSPFWQENEFRSAVAADARKPVTDDVAAANPTYWRAAKAAFDRGQIDQAGQLIEFGQSIGEDPVATLVVQIYIAQAQKNFEEEQRLLEQLRSFLDPYTLSYVPITARSYGILHHRSSLTLELVPGFLNLTPDYGQYELLDNR